MNFDHSSAAANLSDASRRGSMADAYGIVRRLRYQDLREVALRAGFSVPATRDARELRVYVQGQIAAACQSRTDGYGLQALAK